MRPSASWRTPRFPYRSPRAGTATSSPRGVTRFCTGTSAEPADALDDQVEEAIAVDAGGHVRVRREPGAAPQVDDGAAAAELRGAVDGDVAVHGLEQRAVDHVGHGDRVVD